MATLKGKLLLTQHVLSESIEQRRLGTLDT